MRGIRFPSSIDGKCTTPSEGKLSRKKLIIFAANGIPAQQSVITQIYPDYYVAQLQQQFAQYFSSLQITKVQATSPTYKINAITLSGTVLNEVIAV